MKWMEDQEIGVPNNKECLTFFGFDQEDVDL